MTLVMLDVLLSNACLELITCSVIDVCTCSDELAFQFKQKVKLFWHYITRLENYLLIVE